MRRMRKIKTKLDEPTKKKKTELEPKKVKENGTG